MADVDYCIIGAGFAGLVAALRLKQAGRSVALLEARDRVGGHTFTEVLPDGVGSKGEARGSVPQIHSTPNTLDRQEGRSVGSHECRSLIAIPAAG